MSNNVQSNATSDGGVPDSHEPIEDAILARWADAPEEPIGVSVKVTASKLMPNSKSKTLDEVKPPV